MFNTKPLLPDTRTFNELEILFGNNMDYNIQIDNKNDTCYVYQTLGNTMYSSYQKVCDYVDGYKLVRLPDLKELDIIKAKVLDFNRGFIVAVHMRGISIIEAKIELDRVSMNSVRVPSFHSEYRVLFKFNNLQYLYLLNTKSGIVDVIDGIECIVRKTILYIVDDQSYWTKALKPENMVETYLVRDKDTARELAHRIFKQFRFDF